MCYTTDELIEVAMQLNENPSHREMDMLLSTGEQISIALLAMALEPHYRPMCRRIFVQLKPTLTPPILLN